MKASRYTQDPHKEVSSRCCWQSVQTERQAQTDVASVISSARPAGSSFLFIGPSFFFFCLLFFPIWPVLHFSPIQKQFPVSFLLPLDLQHVLTLTQHHRPPRLHPESEPLSTFSVGWAALPPSGKRTQGGSQTSSPVCPW